VENDKKSKAKEGPRKSPEHSSSDDDEVLKDLLGRGKREHRPRRYEGFTTTSVSARKLGKGSSCHDDSRKGSPEDNKKRKRGHSKSAKPEKVRKYCAGF